MDDNKRLTTIKFTNGDAIHWEFTVHQRGLLINAMRNEGLFSFEGDEGALAYVNTRQITYVAVDGEDE
ncbi:hypothetical protein ACFQS3_02435 [Glycomyces mayteni]|uniref:Uncharacterized protein n=1 Tax=Glycomyces mayteni TaxID=543887 RepID=A0ABW2D4J5_9ACTN|nr:hypothetical protein GCM10025732_47870 [Glycomyces mayteni]